MNTSRHAFSTPPGPSLWDQATPPAARQNLLGQKEGQAACLPSRSPCSCRWAGYACQRPCLQPDRVPFLAPSQLTAQVFQPVLLAFVGPLGVVGVFRGHVLHVCSGRPLAHTTGMSTNRSYMTGRLHQEVPSGAGRKCTDAWDLSAHVGGPWVWCHMCARPTLGCDL